MSQTVRQRRELAAVPKPKPAPRITDPAFQYHNANSHNDNAQSFLERQVARGLKIKEEVPF